jgi:ribosomal protein S18 acetylase RimI-like enzyme
MTITEHSIEAHVAVAALGDAFHDDRVFRWISPDDNRRWMSTRSFFDLAVEAFAAHDGVYVAPGGAGAALWLPPGRTLVPDEEAEEFGRRVLDTAGDEADAARLGALLEVFETSHPHEPHWYLNFLGVRPASQGLGIGSALLTEVLAIADRDGVPAYLEATSPDNRRLYERHGFRVTGELGVDDSPTLYAMWREPQV